MRFLLAAAALGVASSLLAAGPAQPFPRDDQGRVRFQGVVPVEGASAADLYNRAKFWSARAFKSAKDVTQLDDQTTGRLIIKAMHRESYGATETCWYRFTLAIEVKDGRFRWTLDQVEYSPDGTKGWPIERELTTAGVGIFGRKAVHERFRLAALALGADLASAMKTAPAADNW